MVKLHISNNFLVIVSHQKFFSFSFDPKSLSWIFQSVVDCTENIPKSNGFIECCAFSSCEKYFGICFDKNIILYSTSSWSGIQVCSGERKASCFRFFPTSKLILIADRSGCATFYSFKEKLIKTDVGLGHNSMLTSALITEDEKYVITSDRDEKIRVTNYPNVYNIENYCLGHDMFVTGIGFLPTDNRILISSSGDGSLRFWNFLQGKELALFYCNHSKTNSRSTIVKFVTFKINQVSVIAIFEYKSNEIKIINVKGDLNTTLTIELIKTLTLKCTPWDISFYNKTLVCLLPDKENPIVLSSFDKTHPQENFMNVTSYITENWDSVLKTSDKNSDEVLVLFKREVDNLQEYEQRKKARLLKTGKTS